MRKPTILMTLLGLALVLVLPAGLVAAAPGWTGPARVVADNYPLSPSVVFKGGYFHVAYLHQQPVGGDVPDGIFYASNASGIWTKERVTTGDDFYARPSIAVDDGGHVHIAFARVCFTCEPLESNIWLASNATGDWQLQQLTDGREDLAPSLVYSSPDLSIAFMRRGRGIIWGTNASGPWQFERAASTVGLCPTLFVFPSLTVDESGFSQIAYERPRATSTGCNPSTTGIRVLRRAGPPWSSTTISTDTDDIQPRMALDLTTARPQLIFQRAGTGLMFTRLRPNLTWSPVQFAADGDDASIAVDAAGKAHIAYEFTGPHYATNKSGSWVVTPLADYSLDFGTNSPVGIVLTMSGKARVLYARAESDGTEESLGLYLAREQ